VLDENKS